MWNDLAGVQAGMGVLEELESGQSVGNIVGGAVKDVTSGIQLPTLPGNRRSLFVPDRDEFGVSRRLTAAEIKAGLKDFNKMPFESDTITKLAVGTAIGGVAFAVVPNLWVSATAGTPLANLFPDIDATTPPPPTTNPDQDLLLAQNNVSCRTFSILTAPPAAAKKRSIEPWLQRTVLEQFGVKAKRDLGFVEEEQGRTMRHARRNALTAFVSKWGGKAVEAIGAKAGEAGNYIKNNPKTFGKYLVIGITAGSAIGFSFLVSDYWNQIMGIKAPQPVGGAPNEEFLYNLP